MDRRRRNAITAALASILLVFVIALVYASFRDPGPQPKVPPTITGTDDRALKRAIIHYVGALQSRDPAVLTQWISTSGDAHASAAAAVATFGDAAQKPANASVTDGGGAGGVKSVTLRFANGQTEVVHFAKDGDRWRATPQST